MKSVLIICTALILCLPLCACGQNEPSAQPTQTNEPSPSQAAIQPEAAPSEDNEQQADSEAAEMTYPYADTEGRVHHLLYVNGELVETQHDPYTYPDEPKGAFYPIVEILEKMGVECLFDEHLVTLATKINGQVITCNADNTDIVVGKVTLGGTAPEYIDGCFYVPSYTFMRLLDATVDFTSDRSGVTMNTNMVIDPDTSGIEGLSISAEAAAGLGEQHYSGVEACALCRGTGRSGCTACSGTGNVTQFSQSRNPVTGQMAIQSSRVFCSRCGGSGHTTCSLCGGTGKR